MSRINGSLAGLVCACLALSGCDDDDDDDVQVSDSAVQPAGGTGGTGAPAGGTAGAGGSDAADSGTAGDLDLAVCDPIAGTFSTTIDNPYLPYRVGSQWIYQGEDDGATLDLRITVLDETEVVAGVTTRVVEEREEEDGELVEISRNFFVQAADGTVCYFGEDVDIYEDEGVITHEGAWRAEGENRPGIVMPGTPAVGMRYQQELAPGVALDRAEIVSMGTTVTVTAGTYTDTLSTEESSPLDSGTSSKTYARDVGLIIDEPAELVSFSSP